MNDIITIRGERDLWIDFVHKVKKDKKKLWQGLKPFLTKYTISTEETRLLLLLFPSEIVDELIKREDPDQFMEDAVRRHLENELSP